VRICMMVANTLDNDSRVLREADALSRAGHEVHILALRGSGAGRAEARSPATVHRLPLPTFSIVRCLRRLHTAVRPRRGSHSEPTQPSPQDPGPTLPTRLDAVGKVAQNVWLNLRYARQALRLHADAYHAHDVTTLLGGAFAAALGKATLVYDSHELSPEDLPESHHVPMGPWRWYAKATQSLLVKHARARFTVGELLAEELELRYGAPFTVLRNVPDEGDPSETPRPLRHTLQLEPESLLAIYVGSVTTGRGLEQAVASLSRLPPHIHLILVGPEGAVSRRQVTDWARRCGVHERVHLLPAVPEGQVLALARTADVGLVLTQPTPLNNFLSLPNKLFQYVQAGLPVVASNLPNIQLYVERYDLGTVVDPTDRRAIAVGLEAVTQDLDRYRRAASSAAQDLSWEREKAVLVKIYDRLARGATS